MEPQDATSNCVSPPEWDRPFTDQELQTIEAIEAQYQHSFSKKRQSNPHDEISRPKTRRQLPSSVLASFSLSPCQANPKMKYPAMRFGGQILYSRTSMEVEKAAVELLQILKAKKRENCQVAIGVDIEWKPTFKRGVLPGKTAVMQICCDANQCHVMHIIHCGIPPSLQLLLEDTAFLKVGVGIGNDAAKVFKDYNVSIKVVEDLSYLANQKLGGDSKKWGLASLTETLVCKELQKPNKIRMGNWETNVLSKDQLQYAATDAFASWHLYQVLKSLPELVKDAAEERS
ncbi:hypothetical protein ACOSP7_006404 [Xanthoceras sorbifolium]|uniref:3'-5' exonuclease n=1 Tax=Xanthoceras sorbifolium TaxID=99658 RepID=A0ABQ8I8P1_9ROSI|nr:hypothetical protein JRO89_XS03G0049200 [Xanthoceras sorbifolium]